MTLDDAQLEIKYLFLTAVSEQIGIKIQTLGLVKKKKKTPAVCVTQGLEKRREESDERKYCVSIRSSKLMEI